MQGFRAFTGIGNTAAARKNGQARIPRRHWREAERDLDFERSAAAYSGLLQVLARRFKLLEALMPPTQSPFGLPCSPPVSAPARGTNRL